MLSTQLQNNMQILAKCTAKKQPVRNLISNYLIISKGVNLPNWKFKVYFSTRNH